MKIVLTLFASFLPLTSVLAAEPSLVQTADAGVYHAAATSSSLFTPLQLAMSTALLLGIAGFFLLRFVVSEEELIARSSFGRDQQ